MFKKIDVVMFMNNLVKYRDNNWKTSGNLSQYCKDEPTFSNNNIVGFNGASSTDSFNFKVKITGETGSDGPNNIEIAIP